MALVAPGAVDLSAVGVIPNLGNRLCPGVSCLSFSYRPVPGSPPSRGHVPGGSTLPQDGLRGRAVVALRSLWVKMKEKMGFLSLESLRCLGR